jgi:hypothetical protein
MAKSVLLNVLNGVLGDYLEGVTADDLKASIWAGEVSLKHVRLKRQSIGGIHIIHGEVDALKVKIPWFKLETEAVRIELTGILISVGASGPEPQTKGRAKRKQLLDKDWETYVALLQAKAHAQSKPSYFDRLAAKIMENLELMVQDVHICYASPEVAIGVKLGTFCVSTIGRGNGVPTEGMGGVKTVGRWTVDTKGCINGVGFMHKRAKIDGLSVYCTKIQERADDLVATASQSDSGGDRSAAHDGALPAPFAPAPAQSAPPLAPAVPAAVSLPKDLPPNDPPSDAFILRQCSPSTDLHLSRTAEADAPRCIVAGSWDSLGEQSAAYSIRFRPYSYALIASLRTRPAAQSAASPASSQTQSRCGGQDLAS